MANGVRQGCRALQVKLGKQAIGQFRIAHFPGGGGSRGEARGAGKLIIANVNRPEMLGIETVVFDHGGAIGQPMFAGHIGQRGVEKKARKSLAHGPPDGG
jgi:hypothetical protein